MKIRQMTTADIDAVAAVHAAAFPRQQCSLAWVTANFGAYPRMQFFVAETADAVVGFIHWTQRSGFRPEAVLELEQIAVHPNHQGQGIGKYLIEQSLPLVKAQLATRNATIKHVIVTTRADNLAAQKLYRHTLGAEIEATFSQLFSADEVYMIARHIDI